MATEKRLIDPMRIDFDEVDISGCTDIDDIIYAVEKLIDAQPAVDAVEVIRCKDCRFRKSTFNGDGYFCSVWDTDDYEEAYVKDNDFCSYGERKDNVL